MPQEIMTAFRQMHIGARKSLSTHQEEKGRFHFFAEVFCCVFVDFQI